MEILAYLFASTSAGLLATSIYYYKQAERMKRHAPQAVEVRQLVRDLMGAGVSVVKITRVDADHLMQWRPKL